MCDFKNKNGNTGGFPGIASFTIGALIGAGAGFLLTSKQGRKYVKDAWKKVEPYVEDVRDNMDEVRVRGKDAVEEALFNVKDLAENVKGIAENVSDFAEGVAEKVPSSIKKPLKKTFFKGV